MAENDVQFSEYLKLRKRSNPAALERIKAMDKLRRNTFEHFAEMIDGGGARNTNPAVHLDTTKREVKRTWVIQTHR